MLARPHSHRHGHAPLAHSDEHADDLHHQVHHDGRSDSMNLHPYDGIERRFRHTDINPKDGLAVIARILKLEKPPAADGLLYDLSFYSGGSGIFDKLAISLSADAHTWSRLIAGLGTATPEALCEDPEWRETFGWFLDHEAGPEDPRVAAARFVNENRATFQPECLVDGRLLFAPQSD